MFYIKKLMSLDQESVSWIDHLGLAPQTGYRH